MESRGSQDRDESMRTGVATNPHAGLPRIFQVMAHRNWKPRPSGSCRARSAAPFLPRIPDKSFDLHANNGRILEHFHEGNMTYRVPGINQETPEHWIEISP